MPDRPPADEARERSRSRIGFATAAASAYQRSEPRWIQATGCLISRLRRIDSSLPSTRLLLPENQSSQRRSTQLQHAITSRITAPVATT